MIVSVRNWVAAIAAISIVLTLFDAITPQNAAGRFAGLCGSLILSFVVLSPIADLSFFDDMFNGWEYDNNISEYVEQRIEENNKLEKIIIENQMSE